MGPGGRKIPDIGMVVERLHKDGVWREDWMTMRLYQRRQRDCIAGEYRLVENRDSVLTWGAGQEYAGETWRYK